MFESIFTKSGTVKKYGPRKYKCAECGNTPPTREAHNSSYCRFCGGNYVIRTIYKNWKQEKENAANEIRKEAE
ncbi:hypothetical protein PCORN_10837 [Listeria cornellensis FSL F6-0969]|uniref:Uncharacterized protein n=1 Tax=Listeria cornellensis FSL F6-0969 TaxID=1265820 RepID=W7C203_9LIST|nr:hypothetical protein PCORN_10837 [Listeria cornellensis FSL F6-0969]